MLFVQAIVIIIVLGIVWYFLEGYIKEPFKTFAIVVAILGFCVWLLNAFGIIHFPMSMSGRT